MNNCRIHYNLPHCPADCNFIQSGTAHSVSISCPGKWRDIPDCDYVAGKYDYADPTNANYVVVAITPGVNQQDSVVSARMLQKMYTRWCKRHGFVCNIANVSHMRSGSVTLSIQGKNVYNLLKSEDGVHRMVRMSTDIGKRCTSFVAVTISRGMDTPPINWDTVVRTYVFEPYQLVKDARTGHETSNINDVLDGDLDQFITARLQKEKNMGADPPWLETKVEILNEEDKKMKTITDWSDEYSFLRNDYEMYITYESAEYPSVEHAYQASKTDDLEIRDDIADATVREARKIGKSIQLSPGWEARKLHIMEFLLRQKFLDAFCGVESAVAVKDGDLGQRLLKTGDSVLEMHTKNDSFWGISPSGGENHMGKILMKIREELRMMVGKPLVAAPVDSGEAIETRINKLLNPLDDCLADMYLGNHSEQKLIDTMLNCAAGLQMYAEELLTDKGDGHASFMRGCSSRSSWVLPQEQDDSAD